MEAQVNAGDVPAITLALRRTGHYKIYPIIDTGLTVLGLLLSPVSPSMSSPMADLDAEMKRFLDEGIPPSEH